MPSPERDYYAVLGVDRTASADEIHHAYWKLARRFHPDLNPGNRSAEENFKRVQEAYDVLRHPHEREMYDQAQWPERNDSPPPAAAEPPPACDQAGPPPAVDYDSFDGVPHVSSEARRALRRRVALLDVCEFVAGLLGVLLVSAILFLVGIGPQTPLWLIAIPAALYAAGFFLGRDILSLMLGLSFVFVGLGPQLVGYLARVRGYLTTESYTEQRSGEIRMYVVVALLIAVVPALCGVSLRQKADKRKTTFQDGWTGI